MRFAGSFDHLSAAERRAHRADVESELSQRSSLWVFGYGSLLWRPCYVHVEARSALARGFARRLCVWTVEARGTPDRPGIGLGLDKAPCAECTGIVHRIATRDRQAALDALFEREMLTGIYEPRWIAVDTDAGSVDALAFVVDRSHPQYAGDLDVDEQARLVASARGELGSCLDYVLNTVDALACAGIVDAELARVATTARGIVATTARGIVATTARGLGKS